MVAMLLNPPRRRRNSRGRRKKVCFSVRVRRSSRRRRRSARGKRRSRRIKRGSSAWHARKAEAYVKKVARDQKKKHALYSGYGMSYAANGRGTPVITHSWRKRRSTKKGSSSMYYGRRRRKARNSGVSYNYRRKRSRNSSWVPAYAHNPSRAISGVTAAFDVKTLSSTLPVIGGFIGNKYVSNFLSSLSFVPSMLKSGIGRSALDVLSAGILGAGVGMVSKAHGGEFLLGGLIQAMTGVAQAYVMPVLGVKAMGEYLTVGNTQDLVNLGSYFTVEASKHLKQLNGADEPFGMNGSDEPFGMNDDLDGADDLEGMNDDMDGTDADASEIG